jgi:hypothetical protein
MALLESSSNHEGWITVIAHRCRECVDGSIRLYAGGYSDYLAYRSRPAVEVAPEVAAPAPKQRVPAGRRG